MIDTQDFVILNVAVKPPVQVAERLVASAQKLIPPDAVFSIDGISRQPHLTLYMATFPRSEVEHVSSVLKDILLPSRVRLDAIGINIISSGYVEISYGKTETLLELQRKIVHPLAPSTLPPRYPPGGRLTRIQEENISRFNYDLIGDSFRPHITLGRLREDQVIEFRTPSLDGLSFFAEQIIIGKADSQGAITHVEYTIDIPH